MKSFFPPGKDNFWFHLMDQRGTGGEERQGGSRTVLTLLPWNDLATASNKLELSVGAGGPPSRQPFRHDGRTNRAEEQQTAEGKAEGVIYISAAGCQRVASTDRRKI